MQRIFGALKQQVDEWRAMQLSTAAAKLLIYQAFIEEESGFPKHLARRVHELYFQLVYEKFRPTRSKLRFGQEALYFHRNVRKTSGFTHRYMRCAGAGQHTGSTDVSRSSFRSIDCRQVSYSSCHCATRLVLRHDCDVGSFAVVGLLTAIGLFRVKSWARYSTLIFAALLVFTGLIVAPVVAFVPMPPPPKAPGPGFEQTVRMVRVVMVAFWIGVAALGSFWLFYFNRNAVKHAFTRSAAGTGTTSGVVIAGRSVPLSIAIIGGLSLLGAVCCWPSLLLRTPMLLFGFSLTGSGAMVATLLIGFANGYVGVALLRLQDTGRKAAIALQCLWLVNGFAFLLMPAAKFRGFFASMPLWAHPTPVIPFESMLPLMRFGNWAGIITSLVVLYFLITRGWAFRNGVAVNAAAL